MASQESTEGLVRRALKDPVAFAALVEQVRPRLEVWLSLRMGPVLKSRLSEEDAMQETLLHAYRSLGDFRDQGQGSFRRWILSVAENRLKDLHKYHAAQRRDPAREAHPRTEDETRLMQSLAASGSSPSSLAHRHEVTRRLSEAIAALPDTLREILLLRMVEERTMADAAKALQIEVSAARGFFARALQALRAEIQKDGENSSSNLSL